MNSKKAILTSYNEVSPLEFFQGVVVCIQPKFYLISFYNDVTVSESIIARKKPWLNKTKQKFQGKLSKDSIPAELRQNFTLGQNVNVRVEKAFPLEDKLQLSMADYNEKQKEQLFEVGREYNAVIGQVTTLSFHPVTQLIILLLSGHEPGNNAEDFLEGWRRCRCGAKIIGVPSQNFIQSTDEHFLAWRQNQGILFAQQ